MTRIPSRLFLFFVLLTGACVLAGCGRPLHKNSQFLMGTLVEVISEDPRAQEIVFGEFKRLEKVVNLFDQKSELAQLNRTGDLIVSNDLFEVLAAAKKFYGLTDGVFDVTVGPVALIWKEAVRKAQVPGEQEVRTAMEAVGFGNVFLNARTRQVKFLKFGVKLDLGGIAEGFALDSAVAKLRAAGIVSALINAGGDMYALGRYRGRPWQVAIQDPRHPNKVIEKISLADQAAATSGDYEQFFVFKNKRYSHIIDPRTGYPAESGIASATVVAPDAVSTDVLSTALVVLGREKGADLLKKFPRVSVKLIDVTGKVHGL